jgi:signal transduction histidine kinase
MRRQFLRVTGWGCLAATVLGIAYSAHSHFVGEHDKPVLWSTALADYMSFWLGWGLLSGALAWFAQRFPISRQHARNAFYHLAASAVVSPLHSTFCYLVTSGLAQILHQKPSPMEASMSLGYYVVLAYPRGMVYYWLVVAIVHALNYYHQYEERAMAAEHLEAQLAQAKLHLLKMQLHPHFLFNTLNSISALLHEDVEQADLMIERMGDFLRLTLDHSTAQEVALWEELEFVSCYLAIEQVRLQERLISSIQAEPEARDALVPSLILQPLVENAIRYAIAPRSSPGRLEIGASIEGPALVLTVRDDGPGLEAAGVTNGTGMGLKITRSRLESLYGSQHRFELVNADGGGLLVTLEIPFITPSVLGVAS